MECWYELVSNYPVSPEPKYLGRALRIAETLLTTDLASFEIEWLVQTFFSKPVNVFTTIQCNKDDEIWLKNISDTFKIISKFVNKYWIHLENESGKFIELCSLSYDAQTKKEAILCLINVLSQPGVDIGDARRHIDALDGATNCKAPLALLVGTICRNFPESVDQEYNRIWRIYLRMLQPQNITDTIVNAVLQGIDGLFENFGRDLPVQELNDFYAEFSRKFPKMAKCIASLLSILKSHAGLFKEKLLEDQVLRLFLWGINSPNVGDALLNTYTVIFEDLSENRIKDIIRSEIQPRLLSESSIVRHTALRIIFHVKIQYQIQISGVFRPDELEYQMRYRSISIQDTELVSICLRSSESYVRSLLATCITYYDNVPATLRQGIVVQGVIDASADDRKVILNLLIELSRQDGGLEKYSDLWRGLINSDDHTNHILADVLLILEAQFSALLDAPINEEQALSLTSVLTFVLSASEIDGRTEYCAKFKPIVVELAACMCVCPLSLLYCKFMSEEMYQQSTILKELQSSLDSGKQDPLTTIQAIFSKDNVEPKLLIRTLSEMDNLLKKTKDLDFRRVSYIMNQISKLKSRRFTPSVDTRVLDRNLTMFLGEHRRLLANEMFDNELCSIDKSKLSISIPHVTEGHVYKIDLLKVLQMSLVSEQPELLYCLLVIISANLRDRPDPSLHSLTWKCIHGLIKCHVDADVTSVLRMCVTQQCVRQAIDSISSELNPEFRRHLCDCLQVLLNEDPGSEQAGQLMTLVGEQLLVMIDCPKSSPYECGLDITRVFINTLQHDHALTLQYLTTIVVKISSKINNDTFKLATELYVDKIDIFDDEHVKKMASDIVENIKVNNNKLHLELILKFLKNIFELKFFGNDLVIKKLLECLETVCDTEDIGDVGLFANILQILALSKHIFDFNDTEIRSIIMNHIGILERIDTLLAQDTTIDVFSNILKFIKEYAVELLDLEKEKTQQCLSTLIENLPQSPLNLTLLKKDIATIMQTFKQDDDHFKEHYQKWCSEMKINKINNVLTTIDTADIFFIQDKIYTYIDTIKSLAIASEVFDWPIPVTGAWSKILLTNESKLREEILTDLLSISVKSVIDFDSILKDYPSLVLKYLKVYFEKIIESNMELDMNIFVGVLKMFVNNYKKYEKYYDKVLHLVEKTWPTLDQENFEHKLSVATYLLRLPRAVGLIPPVTWLISVITDVDAVIDHKIKLMTVLPGGDVYSACYRQLAGLLPTRLSEMRDEHAGVLRALLDSLANTGDLTLLEIVVTLAAADATKGWWDDAFDSCISSLADRRDENIYDTAFNACKKRPGFGACGRVFVPLLRHSSWLFCERYACKIIESVLTMLKTGYKEPTHSHMYRDRVLLYAQAFAILQAVIEKLPAKNLESGVINVSAGSQKPWFVVKTVCMYSVTLRNKVRCPDDATDEIREACLRLQCSAYNCLTSALVKRRPPQEQYTCVFSDEVWSKIVDADAEYEFQPIAYIGDSRKKQSDDRSVASTSFTGTVRTRIFMATLTENPLQYDLNPLYEDEEEVEEQKPLPYESHPLNAYGCLATITTLLEHATTLDHAEWLTKLTDGLKSTMHVNAKWTLAQAICNAQTDLTPHASILTPALLDLIVATPKYVDGKKLLNNLHIDVLWTIIKWNIQELDTYNQLNTCIEYLINTCIEYRNKESVTRRLLGTLTGILTTYTGKVNVSWTVLQSYCNDLPYTASYLMPILQRILKNGIRMPELLPMLFAKCDAKQWASITKLPEVFGLALSLETKKDDMLAKFWQILGSVKSSNISKFVRMLLYAQRVCHQCCNLNFYKVITDLAPKAEKSKCLLIISIYLDNLLEDDGLCNEMLETIALRELVEGDYSVEAMKVVHGAFKFMEERMRNDIVSLIANNCTSGSSSVRKQALLVMLKVFQDFVSVKYQHGPKRVATSSSPILNTMQSQISYQRIAVEETCRGMFDKEEEIAGVIRDGVEVSLSKDITLRCGELFYLIFNFATSDSKLSEYGYVFLDLLFRDLRQQEGFKNSRISDVPLPASDISYVSLTAAGTSLQKQTVSTRREINVLMPVGDILEVFLQSAKDNSQICQELCVQILRRLQGSGRRFDLDETIAKLLADLLKKEPSCLTPLYLEVSRIFMNSVTCVDGFRDSLNDLKIRIQSSQAISYYNILYEDLLLRTEGRGLFDFSSYEDSDVEMKYETDEFSIQNVIKVFGHLSNWDDLRIQDKKRIEVSLPPLLVQREQFEYCLQEYFERLTALDYKLWFNKMVGAYYLSKDEPVIQYKEHWLKDLARWPTRDFTTSAIIEAIQWTQEDCIESCEISSSDCLAEWAARLMVRSAYRGNTTKTDELQWCREANNRDLPQLALQCIDRNKDSLLQSEALSWFYQKLEARRLLALRETDQLIRIPMLQKILDVAVSQDTESMLCFKKLILQLQMETQLSTQDSENIINYIKDSTAVDSDVLHSDANKDTMKSIYEVAMTYCHGTDRPELVSVMVDMVAQCVEYNISNDYNLLISILLNTLSGYEGVLDHDSSNKILNKLDFMLPNLDIYSIEQIRAVSHVFPDDVWTQHPSVQHAEESLNVCKEYLQLIKDPMYTLQQCCSELINCKDSDKWTMIFSKMKKILFTSQYGGTDYKSLHTMKNKLYGIENGDMVEKHRVLKRLLDELNLKSQRSVLLLKQLSPHLTRSDAVEAQREQLRKLLSLPRDVHVVKFDDKVQVFRDSIRRPCVVSVVLTNGLTKRYIIKTGEPLANDASVQRAIAILPKFYNGQVRSYKVTTLSEESAIIEYLEDHERLRDVMGEQVNVVVNRLADDKLVLSPGVALEEHTAMCNKVPVHTLRSSIENRCSSVEEFIVKKQMFLNTLSSMTVTNWLFGVGDRHLHNIMYNKKDGGICGVDWASTFQYGVREYVPARLTGNVLAVCDLIVLESRLQTMLTRLREKRVMYEAFIMTSFCWTKKDFVENTYISAILEGRSTSYDVIRDELTKSQHKHKVEIVRLLDSILKNTARDAYSVEEQVSCLLKHCTLPKLLSVIPSGWEAWV